MKVELVPFKDIEIVDGGFVALSAEATFEVRFRRGIPAGAWLRWRYRAGLVQHLVRPLLVYEGDRRVDTDPMAAPLFGKSDWVGQIPRGCRRVLLRPVDRPGRFAFALDDCRRVLKMTLLPRAFRNSRLVAWQSVGAEFILAPRESRQALLYARQGIPLESYAGWKRDHLRTYEPEGFDRIAAPHAAPHIDIVVHHEGMSAAQLINSPLAHSLRRQRPGQWTCHFIGPVAQGASETVPGFRFLAAGTLPQGAGDDYVASLCPSDTLADYAFAAIGLAANEADRPDLIYADEEVAGTRGAPSVFLKPDWSPIFEQNCGYVGHAAFWRRGFVESIGEAGKKAGKPETGFESGEWRKRATSNLDEARVRHVRRVLLNVQPRQPILPAPHRIETTSRPLAGRVRVIIPSRNALHLIGPCLDGLFAIEDQEKLDIVLVDNGTTDGAVIALYKQHARRSNFSVLEHPGPFNYSRLCNLGAAGANADVLLFLNNDISMPNRGWLAPLVDWALRPDVGAVGARLMFPSGRLQHGGVTIGMGGYAAHQYDNAAPDDPGHLRRLACTHELSAVTGACIAVGREKFEAVGGFDEKNLPVELNDIDLCLRLRARGFKIIQCAEAELIHHQSASRGFSYRPFTRYGQERDYFKARWDTVIRDDPYFHPAFSLYSTRLALDG